MKKKPALKRFPPGDRWVPYDMPDKYSRSNPPELIFDTLTDGLEWIYQNYDSKKFIVDAEEQIVYIVEEEQKVQKPTDNKYSIYGE